MSDTRTFCITIENPSKYCIMVDGYNESLIFVGRLIERHYNDHRYVGKYITMEECVVEDDGYLIGNSLFKARYLIKK
jgi:hypothetical protein